MLSDNHKNKISMLSEEVIEARGYRTIESVEELKILGFKYYLSTPSLYIPYWDIWGRNGFSQHRPDKPKIDKKTGKPAKYVSMSDNLVMDYNPIQNREWLKDIEKHLFVIEAPIKADALISQLYDYEKQFPVLSMSGIWGWKTEGKINEAFDRQNIPIAGRIIIIIPDGDIWTNENIKAACRELKGRLNQKKAKEVIFLALPKIVNDKNGYDDLVNAGWTLKDTENLIISQKNITFQESLLKPISTPTIRTLGDKFIKENPEIIYGLSSFRKWQNGYWQELPDETIKQKIQNFLIAHEPMGITVNSYNKSEINDYIKLDLLISDSRWDDRKSNLIPMANGNFNLINFELEEHDKEKYFTSGFDFDYDQKATCPNWNKVIQTAKIPEDEIMFFQEYAGYCLTNDTKHEIFIFLVGPKASGKSTIIEGIKNVFGPNRSTTLSIGKLAKDRFAKAKIVGKSLIISTESSDSYISNLETINALVSGETLSIEQKYKAEFDYDPICKIIWALNPPLPSFYNPEGGIYRRLNIVQFLEEIKPADRDLSLKGKLKEEKAGIFNWMVEGLKRLTDRGYFIIPDRVIKLNEQFQKDNDIVLSFLEESTGNDEEAFIKTRLLYMFFKTWCRQNEHKPITKRNFIKRLESMGFNCNERIRNKNKNIDAREAIKGLGIKEEFINENILYLEFFNPEKKGKEYTTIQSEK